MRDAFAPRVRWVALAAVMLEINCAGPALPPVALPEAVETEGPPVLDAPTYDTRVASLAGTLARSHIELDTAPVLEVCGAHHGIQDCMRCEVATRQDTAGIDPDLIDAVAIVFARYPSSVLTASNLKHVALCRRIRYAHDHEGVNPAGLAIYEDARLMISIELFSEEEQAHYRDFTIEQVVHHEVFHMIDRSTQGTAVYDDHVWHALNPQAFAYSDPAPRGVPRPAGFVNAYATTDEMEDRASTFEFVMGQPEALCEITAVDPLVAAKVRVVRARIAHLMGEARMPEARCFAQQATVAPKRHVPPKQVQLRPHAPSLLGKMR